jgi:hypothetical protein
MDKKDLIGFFYVLSLKHNINEIVNMLEIYEISKLDILRMYKYIDKYIKNNKEGNGSDITNIEFDND